MTKITLTCESCGAVLKPGARFCVKCGQEIPAVPVPPVNPPAQTPPKAPQQLLSPPPINAAIPPVIPPPTPPVSIPPPPPIPAQPAATLEKQEGVPAIPPPPPSQVFDHPTGSPPQVPSSPGSETVLHVIGMVTRKTGMFSAIVYHMVLTSHRLIFALQTKEMQKQDVIDARDAAKQQGKGFFGQVGAQMSTRSGQKYLSWVPDLILAENPQNFSISLDQLKVIETYNGNFDDNEPDSMIVKTYNDKLSFTITSAHAVRGELKPFLGNRVK